MTPSGIEPATFRLVAQRLSQLRSGTVGCPDDRHPELKIYISELILDSYEYIPVAYVTMHCVI